MHPFSRHKDWISAQEICRTLEAAGFQAVLAGGCVRDLILGRAPKDFDIASNALPEEVEALFEKTLDVGKSFGVIRVILHASTLEVTTFRKDGPYLDGRRPETVQYADMKEDALRRDFTMNALFYQITEERIIDFVEGVIDIRNKVIRTVGDPNLRFEEDKLRPLRGIRFYSELGFDFEAKTAEAIKAFSGQIHLVSKERIFDELKKILSSSGRLRGLRRLKEDLYLSKILPLGDWPEDKWALSCEIIQRLDPGLEIEAYWSALFLPRFLAGNQDWENFEEQLMALKFSRASTQRIHMILYGLNKVRDSKLRLGARLKILSGPEGHLVLALWTALTEARGELQDQLLDLTKAYKKICGLSLQPAKVFLTGQDLIQAGLPQGPELGQLLLEIELLQLEGKILNRDQAVEWLIREKGHR